MPDLVSILAALVALVIVITIARSVLARVTVYEYERGLKFVNGRLAGLLAPGGYWLFRPTMTVARIDVREQVVPIPGQEVITADGFSIKLTLSVRQQVVDPVVAVTKVE